MKNKTERAPRSISRMSKHSQKPGRKAVQQSRRKEQGKALLENLPALGNSRELVPQTYQESANGQTWARVTSLNPAKLEEMISELSDLREALAPQVSASIPEGKRLFVTPDPFWKISGEARSDGKVLLIRHPGIGWLGFIISHKECERLAEKLTA